MDKTFKPIPPPFLLTKSATFYTYLTLSDCHDDFNDLKLKAQATKLLNIERIFSIAS